MEITVYNPEKGRLETLDAEMTDKNTTWFADYESNDDIQKIADIGNGLLISEFNYSYPIFIDGKSRRDVSFNKDEARALKQMYE